MTAANAAAGSLPGAHGTSAVGTATGNTCRDSTAELSTGIATARLDAPAAQTSVAASGRGSDDSSAPPLATAAEACANLASANVADPTAAPAAAVGMDRFGQQVRRRFGRQAGAYEAEARLQQAMAWRLGHLCSQLPLPAGPRADLGAGTGLLSRALLQQQPLHRQQPPLQLDLCPELLARNPFAAAPPPAIPSRWEESPAAGASWACPAPEPAATPGQRGLDAAAAPAPATSNDGPGQPHAASRPPRRRAATHPPGDHPGAGCGMADRPAAAPDTGLAPPPVAALDGLQTPALGNGNNRQLGNGLVWDLNAGLPDRLHGAALLASSFSLQWLDDPAGMLGLWCRSLGRGGWLVLAVPTAGSFPQWQRAAARAAVPCTALGLPDAEELVQVVRQEGLQLQHCRHLRFSQSSQGGLSTLRHLRRLGASASRHQPLKPGEMRRLLRHWPDDSPLTWELLLLLARRPD